MANKEIEKIAEATEDVKASSKTKKLVRGMGAKLAKCKQVTIKIPIDKQNPKDTEVTVQINGYIFQMKRGVEIEVPEPVKKLLERAKYI